MCKSALSSTKKPALRVAFLGDAEPKPDPVFPHLRMAVDLINTWADQGRLDLVLGIGDLPHKGSPEQYEAAGQILDDLQVPFYPIMGNEEHCASVERFLAFANRFRKSEPPFTSPSHVIELDGAAFVCASPDFDRHFTDEGIAWMLAKVRGLAPKPLFLVVHCGPGGVFEDQGRGVTHPGFSEVLRQPNLKAVFSGDLHLDMERTAHSRSINGLHHLHIPGLERTKIPDPSNHTPHLRVLNVFDHKTACVETYRLSEHPVPLVHQYEFSLVSTASSSSRPPDPGGGGDVKNREIISHGFRLFS